MRKLFFILALPLFFVGCSMEENTPTDTNVLKSLPVDTGGDQTAFIHHSTSSPYGFYAYTPSSYSAVGAEYPLLIFLHGSDEKGNSETDPAELEKVLRNGPPMMIEENSWEPGYPMLVVSPQCHDENWNSEKIHELITFLIDNYQVNKKQIYLTGLSMGGYGILDYICDYGDDSYAAACVPLCDGEKIIKAENFSKIPVWMFHGGDADSTGSVSKSVKLKEAINVLNPSLKAKLTIYQESGNNSWAGTYDGTGMGTERSDYDPFSQSIYDWMFQYKKE